MQPIQSYYIYYHNLQYICNIYYILLALSIRNPDRSVRSIRKSNVPEYLDYLDPEDDDAIEGEYPFQFSSFYFNMISLKSSSIQDFLTVFGNHIIKLKLNLDSLPRKT